jgi:hypothetical protein
MKKCVYYLRKKGNSALLVILHILSGDPESGNQSSNAKRAKNRKARKDN